MNPAQTPADHVRRAYARWEETKGASAQAFLDLFAPDIVLRTALAPFEPHPLAHDRIGIEHARDYFESLVLNLEMLEYATEAVVAEGDRVVWIGHCRWRERRGRREVGTPKVDVWRFEHGKAVSVLEMFDTLGFARLNRLV